MNQWEQLVINFLIYSFEKEKKLDHLEKRVPKSA